MGADVETIRIEGSLLADLYARHADEALRPSYLLTGDGALAEDLVQDAFVRVAGRCCTCAILAGSTPTCGRPSSTSRGRTIAAAPSNAGTWSGRPRRPRPIRMTCRTENASVEP